jgi:hypothetical protein
MHEQRSRHTDGHESVEIARAVARVARADGRAILVGRTFKAKVRHSAVQAVSVWAIARLALVAVRRRHPPVTSATAPPVARFALFVPIVARLVGDLLARR